ncbi:LacI family DNA-binding transcriptional regulator [Dickeya chrysanthemi]|uniref:LacI family DNA-binding transcriptional regulator n=1 Tax=Dickeya chrysanthemi TaxID=556 RepID=A0ABU8JLR8_DICCH|nr:LacI family DNA-binding transcriptional regulator [Dickeya chrysanthemi]MBX9444348.1 LacI family DNA-binding transcriptional regulator [Dickeya chrysanthemi]MCA7006451.1 LacI family transcriptional regulator [Dickeya chrysanthemi]
MTKNLRIRDIALQTGFSVSTVSRVLAGKSNTSEAARIRILTAARQYGVMDHLATGRLLLNSLTVFAPERAFNSRADIFYHKVLQGVLDALDSHDVRLRYCGLAENDSDASLFLEKMSSPETEGAILLGIDDSYIHALAVELNKPCVLVNCLDHKMKLSGVSPAHQLIGEFAANYLIEQGHRQILTVLCLRRYTMEWRLAGIRDAYQQHNLPFIDDLHLLTPHGFGSVETEQAVSDFLATCPQEHYPTAILAGGDFMAVGAVNALHKARLRVPQDISVMSMDGANLASIQDIPLTSVLIPREELGREAVRLLQLQLMQPERGSSNILLNGTLVIRDSVKRIRPSQRHSPVQDTDLYDT